MTARKVLVLLGSPRRKGNSAVLAQHLRQGAEEAGGRVETLYLQGMGIEPCTGCGECHTGNISGCVIDDSMQDIYDKLKGSDAIVFASPIYWFSVSAQLKTVIDRIYAIVGEEKEILKGKQIGILLTYADSDPFVSGAINTLRMFQDIADYLGTTISGSVYGSAFEAGEIENNRELTRQAYELGQKLARE